MHLNRRAVLVGAAAAATTAAVTAAVTGAPAASAASSYLLALRSRASGLFVRTVPNTDLLVADTARPVGIDGWFELRWLGLAGRGGPVYWALFARGSNKFVCAENAGASPLIANRGVADIWEQFYLLSDAEGGFALQARINNGFVRCGPDQQNLIADQATADAWSSYDLVLQSIA